MGKDIIKRIKSIDLKEHKLEVIIIIALIVGILVRMLYIDKYPNALNCDEASSGYEAYSLLKYGVDRNGNTAPAYLVAWGSGQSILYSILEMRNNCNIWFIHIFYKIADGDNWLY